MKLELVKNNVDLSTEVIATFHLGSVALQYLTGAEWGLITGTLSDQTDLQTALNNKSATTHNHNLNDLTEKSYNSLTDKPNLSSLHSHSNKTLLDTYTNSNTNISGAISDRHTHTNKSTLDTYTNTNTDISSAVSLKHSHANKTDLDNVSGTNTGDNATNSQYSGLATSKQDTLISGTNIKTINGTTILGSGDLVVSGGSLPSGTLGQTLAHNGTSFVATDKITVDATATTTEIQETSPNTNYASNVIVQARDTRAHIHLNTNTLTGSAQLNLEDNNLGIVASTLSIDITSSGEGKVLTSHTDKSATFETPTVPSHNHDSTYLGINAKAADSDKLDGIDSTGFATSGHNHTGTYEPANANIQTHISTTGNPHGLTKTDISLGNVANVDQTNPANITQDATHRFATDTEKSTWNGKQDALGFTAENVANKKLDLTDNSDTYYPSQKAVKTAVDAKLAADTTATVTNKRNQKRVYNTTSTSSLTPEISTYDVFEITALAAGLTINNHSTSTPVAGEQMIFRIKDNGTAQTIAYGDKYRASTDLAKPTTTTINKTLYMGFVWNAADSKWDLIALINNI
jgi:uncharacterized Zn-binding protein involved in type VI secretion